jgi:2-oxoglutarate ferredoxin oxidoreductase subunit beta
VRAHDHVGASFVEIYQNCNVFNDGIFEHVKNKKTAAETRLLLEHGKPLVFGGENQKGLRLNSIALKLEVVDLGEDGVSEEDLVVHDETNKVLAHMLAELKSPEFPVPIGVLYCNPTSPYHTEVYEQRDAVRERKETTDLNALLRDGHTWEV